MGLEDFKKIVLEFWTDIVNNQDEEGISKYFTETIEPLVHPEYKVYMPEYRLSIEFEKPEGLLENILVNKRAFPNLKYECLELFAVENKICFCGYFSGNHELEIYGIEPTGNLIHGFFIQIYTIKDGKLYSNRFLNDSLALFQQIGQAVMLKDNHLEIQNYLAALSRIGLIPEKTIFPE